MKPEVVHIKDKLEQLGTPIEEFSLGDYDQIGEYTAKKCRGRDSKNYAKVGAYFRPNYERGLLAYAMVKRYRPQRILEIGFGRGYWATCAAKAMQECDIEGEIISVDVQFDRGQIDRMSKLFPADWLKYIKMMQGRSIDIVPKIEGEFDMVYIDGDHTYNGVRQDWEMVKDRFKQHVVFDDYHLPEVEEQPGIQVARAVDEIEDEYMRELVIMDREVFVDDRKDEPPKQYGQVILRSPNFADDGSPYSYDW